MNALCRSISYFQNTAFGPEEIALLVAAYELTLKKVGLVDRDDPITQMIAKRIIELGQRGLRDPEQLCELAMREMGLG
jgi:hypothetical protein